MRERSIFWDVAMVGLLLVLVVTNVLSIVRGERMERRFYEEIKNIAASGGGSRHYAPPVAAHADKGSNSPSYSDGSSNPKFKRGDEEADDGDALVINEVDEPNSLNPITDNDATTADLYKRANDRLARRCFDDARYWEPALARAWEKAMICRGIATKKNAKELAEKLNTGLSAAEKEKYMITKIEAENDEILRIELSDATGDYREPVKKILGPGAIEAQHWYYVNFQGETFADKSPMDAKTVGTRVRGTIQAAPGFSGRFLPDWERGSSVVIQLVGDSAAAEKAISEYFKSEQNTQGWVTDSKSATGKTLKTALTYELAEHYEFEEKPVYTFYLREGVRWHDSKPFTGKDVVFSYTAMMNPKVECDHIRSYYQDCESVKLVDNDPYRVQFTWKKPYFLSFGYSCEMYLIPEHVFRFKDGGELNKHAKNRDLIGTGPYRLSNWNEKEQLVLVRNEDYWGKKPHFKKIVCKFVLEKTASYQMLLKGDLDIEGLSKTLARQKINDPEFNAKFKMDTSVANQFSYIGWNIRRPIFESVKTRRALTMLVDRKKVVKDIMKDFALPLDVPTHPESPCYPKNAPHTAFDIEGAKKLLAEDGWKDTDGDNVLDKVINGKNESFKFTLLIPSGLAEFEAIANLVKDACGQAGIKVTVSNLEWSVVIQNMERLNFDAVISGWRVDVDDDPYQLFHSTQVVEKGSNHCGYINKDVDRLIEAGRRELNDEKRSAIFQKVYETIATELPYTNLFVSKRSTAYDKRIHNVVYNFQGSQMGRWYVPKAMQKYK